MVTVIFSCFEFSGVNTLHLIIILWYNYDKILFFKRKAKLKFKNKIVFFIFFVFLLSAFKNLSLRLSLAFQVLRSSHNSFLGNALHWMLIIQGDSVNFLSQFLSKQKLTFIEDLLYTRNGAGYFHVFYSFILDMALWAIIPILQMRQLRIRKID